MEFVFTLASLVFLGSLALFTFSRPVRSVVWCGGSLGVVLGLWLLAPMSLEAHRLYPDSLREWFVVVSVLATLFLAIGMLLSLLASWPIAIAQWRPSLRFRNLQAAILAWTLAVVPLGYLGLGAALEWSFFPRLSLPEYGMAIVLSWIGAFLAWLVVCWFLYRRLAGHGTLQVRWVAAFFVMAAAAGLVRLVVKVEAANPSMPGGLAPLTAPTRAASHRPLLVIGLDGGNWRTLTPLIESGKAPTFGGLAEAGVRGQIKALWPPFWSTPAWGSIITGYHQEDLGVYENLGASAPMVPTFELPLTLNIPMNPLLLFDFGLLNAGVIDAAPADRRRLRRPPIWERLPRTDLKTAVVYFPFTYPAIGQADYVISNRAIADIWEMMGVRPGERDLLVSSKTGKDDFMSSLEGALDSRDLLARLLPGIEHTPPSPGAMVDPVEVLRRALDVGERMFNLTERIVKENPDLDLVFLYIGDFDSIGHAFWRYRFPDDYPDDRPSPSEVERLGPVLDRYLAHVDERLGRLVACFPAQPNVIVVSDHGMEASDAVKLWRAWHSRVGIFVAGGPDIRSRNALIDVSYFDVVPTILDLLGYEKPSDLRGHSVLQQAR